MFLWNLFWEGASVELVDVGSGIGLPNCDFTSGND